MNRREEKVKREESNFAGGIHTVVDFSWKSPRSNHNTGMNVRKGVMQDQDDDDDDDDDDNDDDSLSRVCLVFGVLRCLGVCGGLHE